MEFIGVSITSVSYLDLYRVTLCLCSIAFRCSHLKPDTRNSIIKTKVPNVPKCYPCSKLFVNQQKKLYCIYKCFDTQNYFQNLSLYFILKIFLKFRKFQPRYSYKIYSMKQYSMKQSIHLTRAALYFKFIAFRDLTCVRAGATPQRMFEKSKRHGETDVKVLPWSQWFFLIFGGLL